ncbi:DUF4097 domain-containing protein [Lentzea sp. PSKA42]|uniref:DUF4097 domain-containing protein n=1 Tax=Lentzea indica TaxID=2604800 RepID=A0ABX1FK98_9PSEU|nr:DUF4097 family beta strand repeat-containing protein [Lentzea indica]NKE59414.1 DUF4097 domain-containing protein [Lentzea indica]
MQKFATSAPIAAVLDFPAGRVQFIAADRNDTAVDVRPANAAKSRDVKAAERTEVEFADGVLRITGETKNEMFGASGSVEITVQLPAGSRVEAKAASAEFRGVGRLGDIAFEAAQSEIKLDEAASVRLSTQAGDIAVGRLTGSAEITTAKGDITIAEAVRGAVVLSTQAGDVSVTAAAGVSASLDAGTSYGRVQNSLKNNGIADLTIHATTAYGDISARSL